jgi:hypothetical protein
MRERLDDWRGSHARGVAFPEALWSAAGRVAQRRGVYVALGLAPGERCVARDGMPRLDSGALGISSCRQGEPKQPGAAALPAAPRPKAPGHGRNGAAAYTGATRVTVAHPHLHSGKSCPGCTSGKLYPQSEPAKLLRTMGVAPLSDMGSHPARRLGRRYLALAVAAAAARAVAGNGSLDTMIAPMRELAER